jgi:hypothetical protein
LVGLSHFPFGPNLSGIYDFIFSSLISYCRRRADSGGQTLIRRIYCGLSFRISTRSAVRRLDTLPMSGSPANLVLFAENDDGEKITACGMTDPAVST